MTTERSLDNDESAIVFFGWRAHSDELNAAIRHIGGDAG